MCHPHDRRTESVDPALRAATGQVIVRFENTAALQAQAGTSAEFALAFAIDVNRSLTITCTRLSGPGKTPIEGATGVEASFDFRGRLQRDGDADDDGTTEPAGRDGVCVPPMAAMRSQLRAKRRHAAVMASAATPSRTSGKPCESSSPTSTSRQSSAAGRASRGDAK